MSEQNHWWYIYGYFDPGEDNLPHIGQVIRYYRKLCGMTQDELATTLGYTKRYIEMLESDSNLAMPQNLSRRKILVKTLNIPPILLGLSSIILHDGDATVSLLHEEHTIEKEIDIVAETQRMKFYEEMLILSWECYYTSSIQRATKIIDFGFELLNEEAKEAKGFQNDQFDALRCRFHRLSALIARERMEIDKAFKHINEAVSIASRLGNAELIAASLIGRIRIHYYADDYEQALQDAESACFYADSDLLRDPLKGKCYQMLGEAQAHLAGTDKVLQDRSLTSFEKAGKIARKGNLEPDGSFVKTDLTSIYIERAKALRMFKRFTEAHHALAIARKNLSPELTRWQVNLLIEEAKTYLAEGDVTNCCITLIEALPIIRTLRLQSREKPLRSLLEKCKALVPYDEAVKKLEKALASKIALQP